MPSKEHGKCNTFKVTVSSLKSPVTNLYSFILAMDSHKEHGFSFTITDANDLPQRFSKSNPFAQHLESPEPPQTGSSVKWKTLTALDEISEALKLRTYQQELFEKVVGSSIVIYLPTGSGKTSMRP